MVIAGFIFISIGLAFNVIGCIGIIRLPDVYNRMQAATKCVTAGTCGILFGTFLVTGLNAAGAKIIICMIFILLTTPTAAHAISRAALKNGIEPFKKNGDK
jgi:multicomponent Na+:H+ antiporter subunit G